MATQALIALGSNLGDRQAHLGAAVAALDRADGVVVRAVSAYHATLPVGGPGGQGAFLNAAARLETSLHPLALLRLLQEVERQAGRIRSARWGERPLDLDLVLFGDRRLRLGHRTPLGPELVVPHPRFALRRFVLAPLAEVAPGAFDPLTGRTVADLLANLDRRPSWLAFHDPSGRLPGQLVDHVVTALDATLLAEGSAPSSADGREVREGPGDDRWRVSASRPDDPPPAVAPTFVVVPRPGLPGLPAAWTANPIAQGPISAPFLEFDPGDPDAAVADILAACSATRAGL
jgi:2-amino-4-hydroxy-6-hydroxymethyldihydropteridine diphosphokinase